MHMIYTNYTTKWIKNEIIFLNIQNGQVYIFNLNLVYLITCMYREMLNSD